MADRPHVRSTWLAWGVSDQATGGIGPLLRARLKKRPSLCSDVFWSR